MTEKKASEMCDTEYRVARAALLKRKQPPQKATTDLTDDEAQKQFPPNAHSLSDADWKAARAKITQRR